MALPEALSRPAAALTGRVMGLAMRRRRQMLARHLRRVHGPELNGRALDQAVNATFASYGRYWLEVFRLPRQDLLALGGDRFIVEGRDVVDKVLAEGKGVVIGTPHVGNWDL
ncbi:MAG: phosphatidylinositol mannoside acyltransferase, partial [Acidimicrobiia bacterium]